MYKKSKDVEEELSEKRNNLRKIQIQHNIKVGETVKNNTTCILLCFSHLNWKPWKKNFKKLKRKNLSCQERLKFLKTKKNTIQFTIMKFWNVTMN